MKEKVALNGAEYDMDVVASYMDDDVREDLHAELSPCSAQAFLDRYIEEHAKKFAEDFRIN